VKTLVAYSSLTGNTRRVAEAIFASLKGDKAILPISEAGDGAGFERIIIGFWVDKGDANEEALAFIEKLKGKALGVFATLGADPTSEHAKKCLDGVLARLLAKGNEVKASFICRGAIDPVLIERVKAKWGGQAPQARVDSWTEAASHPDEKDFANARAAFAAF
jgi:flavodoxin